MSGYLNRTTLIGNLGSDPEVKSFPDGREIVNLRIATSESWNDRNTGERKERTEWHSVVVGSEGLVRVCKQYLKKGMKVFIEGQLQTRKFEKDGVDHYRTEIIVRGFGSSLLMLDGPGKVENSTGNKPDGLGNRYNQPNAPINESLPSVDNIDELEDIPF